MNTSKRKDTEMYSESLEIHTEASRAFKWLNCIFCSNRPQKTTWKRWFVQILEVSINQKTNLQLLWNLQSKNQHMLWYHPLIWRSAQVALQQFNTADCIVCTGFCPHIFLIILTQLAETSGHICCLPSHREWDPPHCHNTSEKTL